MLRNIARAATLAAAVALAMPAQSQEPVRLYAAGSLKAAMTDIAEAFNRDAKIAVAGTFGASGLLRDRIVKGENAEVFAQPSLRAGGTIGDGGDIFLTYCTNAVAAKKEVPALQIVAIPEALGVGAEYGLTIIKGARPEAERFAAFILSSAGRDILARYGFGLPTR